MEGLRDVNIRSAQTLTRESRIDHDIEPDTRQISQISQRRPFCDNRGFIEPVHETRTGPSGDFEVIWYGVTQGPSNPTSANDLNGSILNARRRSMIS
jgi:hypothetical protein